MSNAAEKVTPIRHDEETGHGSMHEEVMSKTSKDMGKAALFIAILAVLLMVIFFFGIQQNITGITSEMKALAETKTDVLLPFLSLRDDGAISVAQPSMESPGDCFDV